MKVLAGALLLLANVAAADPVAHDDAAVAQLRAKIAAAPDDAVARCTLGAVYSLRGDLGRADLYLAGCEDVELPTELAKQRATLGSRLRDSQLATLQIVSTPAGLTGEVDALPGERFTTPATLWIPGGHHELRFDVAGKVETHGVDLEAGKRTPVTIDFRVPAPPAPKTQAVDFRDEAGAETQNSGPPPDIKHPSLMKKKYLGVSEEPAGPQLEDPFAARAQSAPREVSSGRWLGLRAGIGLFDDGVHASASGFTVAAAARIPLTRDWFAAARADWTKRGGDRVSAAELGGGIGLTVLRASGISVAGIAQLVGDVRFSDGMEGVSRFGAAGALGVELGFAGAPITFGARAQTGITALYAGARDHALLVELGVDLR